CDPAHGESCDDGDPLARAQPSRTHRAGLRPHLRSSALKCTRRWPVIGTDLQGLSMATQMYAGNDPRAALSTAKAGNGGGASAGAPQPSSYGLFAEQPPQIDDANGKTWMVRGQNFTVAYTEAKPGA